MLEPPDFSIDESLVDKRTQSILVLNMVLDIFAFFLFLQFYDYPN